MTSKEADFKTRLAAVLNDIQGQGTKDAEAMWLMGGLASDLSANLKASSWRAAKSRMNRATYDMLLTKFREEGNAHHREGRIKHAYAIQALAMSLIAPTMKDAKVREGGQLLDTLIDGAVTLYRRSNSTGQTKDGAPKRSAH